MRCSLFFLILAPQQPSDKKMNAKEIYSLFLQHPAVTTDSRKVPASSIFFALKGERFNGNHYAADALSRGAAFAVIDDPAACPADADNRYILVHDALKALQQLAHEHRCRLRTPVVQLTGSNGKTTTKELAAAVLAKRHNVLYTQGNLNNHIGVPLTLLRLRPEHSIALIETGANHPGEIAALARIVEPDYGLITNIGNAHLEGFGSIDGVRRAKGELFDFLRPKHAAVFIDADNPLLSPMTDGLKPVRYGLPNAQTDLTVEGETLECNPFLSLRWRPAKGNWLNVHTRLLGAYNLKNALAAAAIGLTFGVSPDDISAALADYHPNNGRSMLMRTARNTLFVDAYNANPTSMNAALVSFKSLNPTNSMVILGDMGELGNAALAAHINILHLLKNLSFNCVWLVGSNFRNALLELNRKGTPLPFRSFLNIDEVKKALAADKPANRSILIKGSHATGLHQLPDLL